MFLVPAIPTILLVLVLMPLKKMIRNKITIHVGDERLHDVNAWLEQEQK
jgi:hypothetical protein